MALGRAHYRLAQHLRCRAQVRWILSYDNHPDLINDLGLYAVGRMTPNALGAASLGVHAWHISKRLMDLRYSASSLRLIEVSVKSFCLPRFRHRVSRSANASVP
jgi:hypothetical protein